MAGAGSLDRRITLERAKPTRDEMGGSSDDGWAPLASVWANRADLSDSERYAADEQAATRGTRFKVRSSTITRDLRANDRITHDGAVYEITGIKETNEGRNRFIEITTMVRND